MQINLTLRVGTDGTFPSHLEAPCAYTLSMVGAVTWEAQARNAHVHTRAHTQSHSPPLHIHISNFQTSPNAPNVLFLFHLNPFNLEFK